MWVSCILGGYHNFINGFLPKQTVGGSVLQCEIAVWDKSISHFSSRHNQNPIVTTYFLNFEKDSNFLWKHINFMFFENLWEKNNPAWVNPCGIRKCYLRGWIFWSGTQQASSLTKLFTPSYHTWILMMNSIVLCHRRFGTLKDAYAHCSKAISACRV